MRTFPFLSSVLENLIAKFVCIVFVCIVLQTRWLDADWPDYRGNLQRTSFRQQSLNARNWKPAWIQKLPAPKSAWDMPARGSIWQNLTKIEPRVTDDQANVPLIATDRTGQPHLLIPSSGDDRLVAYDLRNGNIHWQFDSNAPIRFAPSVRNGIAFIGSDDGYVSAINIFNGDTLWSKRIGPAYKSIFGNGRLISPHPIRTSVLPIGNQVVAHAGLFPGQGVYAVALDQNDGRLIWRRRIDVSSQGYLLATGDDRIYVPTGRSVPYAIDSATGKKLYSLPSPGGSFCMLSPNLFFSGPGNTPSVESYSQSSKAKMLSFQARHVAVGEGKIWTANGSRIACHDLTKVAQQKTGTVWQINSKIKNGLIVSGDKTQTCLFAADESGVESLEAFSGKSISRVAVKPEFGQVIHLAVTESSKNSPETLIATTSKGYVLAWHASQNREKSVLSEEHLHPSIEEKKSIQNPASSQELKDAIAKLKSPNGLALVIGQNVETTINSLVAETSLKVIALIPSKSQVSRLRSTYRTNDLYGARVTVWHHADGTNLPIEGDLFNLVINLPDSHMDDQAVKQMPCCGIGILLDSSQNISVRKSDEGLGSWRHQYAGPRNLADSQDKPVGSAVAFKLKWFGGVGPSRMPDRHLRGPAPLSAGGSLVIQADGSMIGVDPANGIERWQYQMPAGAMRYVTPYDGGYACLAESGENLYLAANQEVLRLDAFQGTVADKIACQEKDFCFGYLSQANDTIVSTLMKPSASRTSTDRKIQRTYVDQDYRSERPLVCSRKLVCLNDNHGKLRFAWTRESKGLIPNGAISVDFQRECIVFIEGRSKSCLEHSTDRVPTQTILQDAYLVSIHLKTGETNWEKNLTWSVGKNILYSQITPAGILLTTSESQAGKAKYYFRMFQIESGSESWSAEHNHIKGGLYHGEQVHHPLILKRSAGNSVLVAEPYFIDLNTGKKSSPFEADQDWAISRPGHSCGTLSGSGNCLFFRANNPTVLNLNQSQKVKFSTLAPSRPGCWINIIPAGGRLLIPEASASCVCKYSLQTSMGFEPVAESELETKIRILPEVAPVR